MSESINLDANQKKAANPTQTLSLLAAMPGSGKTTVICCRAIQLVRERKKKGTVIICDSYQSLKSTQERMLSLSDEDVVKKVSFRTFHSLSAEIISYSEQFFAKKSFRAISGAEAAARIKQKCSSVLGKEMTNAELRDICDKIAYIIHNRMQSDEIGKMDSASHNLQEIYTQYTQTLRKSREMDTDLQQVYSLNLLMKFENIRNEFQRRYQHILVDNAQELTLVQHQILRILDEPYQNLFLAGDDDQIMNSARGADPKLFARIMKEYPATKVMCLSSNYRNRAGIANAAATVISGNRERFEKTMASCRADPPYSSSVHIIPVESKKEICNHVLKLIPQKGSLAIVYRELDDSILLPILNDLIMNGNESKCSFNDISFFQMECVIDIMNILTIAYRPSNAEVFYAVYQKLGLRVKTYKLEEAIQYSEKHGMGIFDSLLDLGGLPPYTYKKIKELQENLEAVRLMITGDGLNVIKKEMGYLSYAEKHGIDTKPLDVLESLTDRETSAGRFLNYLKEQERLLQDKVQMMIYRKNCREMMEEYNSAERKIVPISEMRGQECDTVILLDAVDENLLPVKRSKDEEAERRQMYVTMTRAREKLYLFQKKSK